MTSAQSSADSGGVCTYCGARVALGSGEQSETHRPSAAPATPSQGLLQKAAILPQMCYLLHLLLVAARTMYGSGGFDKDHLLWGGPLSVKVTGPGRGLGRVIALGGCAGERESPITGDGLAGAPAAPSSVPSGKYSQQTAEDGTATEVAVAFKVPSDFNAECVQSVYESSYSIHDFSDSPSREGLPA